MYTDTAAHASGCLQMNTGSVHDRQAEPGLVAQLRPGTQNESLPSFVVMTDPRGGPISGAFELDRRLHARRVPGHAVPQHGRAAARPGHARRASADRTQRESLDLLKKLNEQHLEAHPERIGAGGAHLVLRAGLSDADDRGRGRRSGQGERADRARCTA